MMDGVVFRYWYGYTRERERNDDEEHDVVEVLNE